MKLKKMTLENFCGIKSFELTLGGKDAEVAGENGRGKTTLANAFLWLLTSKGTDQKQLNPNPIGPDGQPINNLESSVEIILEV